MDAEIRAAMDAAAAGAAQDGPPMIPIQDDPTAKARVFAAQRDRALWGDAIAAAEKEARSMGDLRGLRASIVAAIVQDAEYLEDTGATLLNYYNDEADDYWAERDIVYITRYAGHLAQLVSKLNTAMSAMRLLRFNATGEFDAPKPQPKQAAAPNDPGPNVDEGEETDDTIQARGGQPSS